MMLFGHDAVEWVKKRMPENLGFNNPVGILIITDDKISGGVVFENYRQELGNIDVSIAIDNKKCLTRYNIKKLFEYAFYQLNCKRINAFILESNTPSQALCRRLGFVQEGILRRAGLNNENLLVFGFLKNEYESKWLTSSKPI